MHNINLYHKFIVDATIYTVEFQKRGLPHAHILIFLAKETIDSYHIDIDNIILAEIPDKEFDPEYYKVVEEFMIHSPYGATQMSFLCTSDGHCTKLFPKKCVESSSFDEDGYPVYRRRDNGRVVIKKWRYVG